MGTKNQPGGPKLMAGSFENSILALKGAFESKSTCRAWNLEHLNCSAASHLLDLTGKVPSLSNSGIIQVSKNIVKNTLNSVAPAKKEKNPVLFAQLRVHAVLPIGDLHQFMMDKDISLGSWFLRPKNRQSVTR